MPIRKSQQSEIVGVGGEIIVDPSGILLGWVGKFWWVVSSTVEILGLGVRPLVAAAVRFWYALYIYIYIYIYVNNTNNNNNNTNNYNNNCWRRPALACACARMELRVCVCA